MSIMEEKTKYDKFEQLYDSLRAQKTGVIADLLGKNIVKSIREKETASTSTKRPKLGALAKRSNSKPKEFFFPSQSNSMVWENSQSRDSFVDESPSGKNGKAKGMALLTTFFSTKPKEFIESNSLADFKAPKGTFRFLGAKVPSSIWNQERKDKFIRTLDSPSFGTSESELFSAILQKAHPARKLSNKGHRQVFIKIHDSFKKISGIFTRKSQVVTGRRPFAKESSLDYEIDSEDEFEDKNAENLDDDKEDNETTDEGEGDEDDDKFIVPDGYTSNDDDDDDERNYLT